MLKYFDFDFNLNKLYFKPMLRTLIKIRTNSDLNLFIMTITVDCFFLQPFSNISIKNN